MTSLWCIDNHLFVCFCFILGHLLLLSLVSYMYLVIKPTWYCHTWPQDGGESTKLVRVGLWFDLMQSQTNTSGPTLWAASERDSGWGLTISMPGWALLTALKKSEVDTEYLHVVEYLEVNSHAWRFANQPLWCDTKGDVAVHTPRHHRGVVLVALTCRCGIGCT